MIGNPKKLKGTEHSTVRLDVAMFIRRWHRIMSQGKATSAIRSIKRGEGSTTLTVEQLESLVDQANAYQRIVMVMQESGKKPIERYAAIRALIQIVDNEEYHGRQRAR